MSQPEGGATRSVVVTGLSDDGLTPRRLSLVLVIAVVAISLSGLIIGVDAAVLALAVFALAGAVARVFSPVGRSFAVRRRAIDVTVLLIFAGSLGFLGLSTPLG